MKYKVFDNFLIIDNFKIIQPKIASSSLNLEESYTINNNDKKIVEDIQLIEFINNKNSNISIYNNLSVLSECGRYKVDSKKTNDFFSLLDQEKNEIINQEFLLKENITLSENLKNNNINILENEGKESLSLLDHLYENNSEIREFAIKDSISIYKKDILVCGDFNKYLLNYLSIPILSYESFQDIQLYFQDENYNWQIGLCEYDNENKKILWFFDYDLNHENKKYINVILSIKGNYFNSDSFKKECIVSFEDGFYLTYCKSPIFNENINLSLDIIPINIDGNTIEQVKVDVGQNYSFCDYQEFQFYGMEINGYNYLEQNNTIICTGDEGECFGTIKFDKIKFIRDVKIINFGDAEISWYVTLEKDFERSYYSKNKNLYAKNLHWKISLKKNSSVRTILIFFDNDKYINYGNKINVPFISIDYSVYNNWNGTTLTNCKQLNEKIVIEEPYSEQLPSVIEQAEKENKVVAIGYHNCISGIIDAQEIVEWGIIEVWGKNFDIFAKVSDNLEELKNINQEYVEFSVNKTGRYIEWIVELTDENSYIEKIIVWKNNNKIIYPYTNKFENCVINEQNFKQDTVEINTDNFGGFAIKKSKDTKFYAKLLEEQEWTEIITGQEMSDRKIDSLEWKSIGDIERLIIIKDKKDCFTIFTNDFNTENQGFVYGKISLYSAYSHLYSSNSFYRILSLQDINPELIPTNPIFQWNKIMYNNENVNNYLVHFSKIPDDNLNDLIGNIIDVNLNGYYEENNLKQENNNIKFSENEDNIIYQVTSDGKFIQKRFYVGYEKYFSIDQKKWINNVCLIDGDFSNVCDVSFFNEDGKEIITNYKITKENIQIEFEEEYVNNNITVNILKPFNKQEVVSPVSYENHDIIIGENKTASIQALKNVLSVFVFDDNGNHIQLPTQVLNNSVIISFNNTNFQKAKVVLITENNKQNYVKVIKNNSLSKDFLFNVLCCSFFMNGSIEIPYKILENKIDFNIPDIISGIKNYVFCTDEVYNLPEKTLWKKALILNNRKFNEKKYMYCYTYRVSDDFENWSEEKEFNPFYQICDVGRAIEIKIKLNTLYSNISGELFGIKLFHQFGIEKINSMDDLIFYNPGYNLDKNTKYYLRVCVFNGTEYSRWSVTNCYLTNNEDILLSEPTGLKTDDIENNLRVLNVNTNIKFSWDNYEGQTDSIVKSENKIIKNSNNNSFIYDDKNNLIQGKEYEWKVSINTENGISPVSKPERFSLNIIPNKPDNLGVDDE